MKCILLIIISGLIFSGCLTGTDDNTTGSSGIDPISSPDIKGLRHLKTVHITPDENYDSGGFCRVNYLQASDKILVTFGAGNQPEDFKERGDAQRDGREYTGDGYSYKLYTEDMEYTGEHGIFWHGGSDTASELVGNHYYILRGAGPHQWSIGKYDAVTWEQLGEVIIEWDPYYDVGNDQMLEYINGMLDASSLHNLAGNEQGLPGENVGTERTHHNFYTLDLKPQGRRILKDTTHVNGMSAVFVDNTYYFVTSTAYFGELIVLMYDRDFNYLGTKNLTMPGRWPQGTIYDSEDERFFVAYTTGSSINLGVFNREWEWINNYVVTDPGPGYEVDRPYVLLHNNRVYVSYDISKQGRDDRKTDKDWWQCIVKMYDGDVEKEDVTFQEPRPQKKIEDNKQQTSPAGAKSDKCPDGIWDEAEQTDPDLCPEDNPD